MFMNWDAIQAMGELAVAAAVIISLVYLAQQIKASNRLGRAEAWRLPTSDLNSLNAVFAQDSIFREVLFRAEQGGEIREGILDNEAFDDFAARAVIKNPYYRAQGATIFKPTMDRSFAEFFEVRFRLAKS